MRTLIVYAYPRGRGHNHEVLRQVKRQLKERGERFEIIDLYDDGFNPVMSPGNHDVAFGKPAEGLVKRYQEMVMRARRFVFIHPLWWNATPAILKGFFDKVFASKVGFRYVPLPFSFFGVSARPIGLFEGRAAVIVTSGAPVWASVFFQGGRGGKVVAKDTLGFCGIRARVFRIGGCTKLDGEKKKEIKKKVVHALRWL